MERGGYRGGRGDGRGRGGGGGGRGYGGGGGGGEQGRGRGYGGGGGEQGRGRGPERGGGNRGQGRGEQQDFRSQSQWGPPPGHGGRGTQSQQPRPQVVPQPSQAPVSYAGSVGGVAGRGAWGRRPQVSSDSASPSTTVVVSEPVRVAEIMNPRQKLTIVGLSLKDTKDIKFDLIDQEGNEPPRKTTIVEYFRIKYGRDIVHKDIPCLDLGKIGMQNFVPMEFCDLVEGQIYLKDKLAKNSALWLKKLSLVNPKQKQKNIDKMIKSRNGTNTYFKSIKLNRML